MCLALSNGLIANFQEEEALARKAKEEEVAALEFENWKGEFSVDAEGTTETDAQDGSQGLLSDFIEYIKVTNFHLKNSKFGDYFFMPS